MTKRHLYEKIAAHLRQQIASGSLQPGDRLPSVREMGREWRCTPGTVNRAYKLLADEKLVGGRRGGGTRVLAPPVTPERPSWQWAALINQADGYLLEAIRTGHSPAQAEAALAVAISRWNVLQEGVEPETAVSTPSPHTRLRFIGSHDMLIEFAVRMWQERLPDLQISVEFAGSLGGLMALAQGRADIAGAHLWDGDGEQYNYGYVRRILPGRPTVLLGLAYRALGLLVPPGNPQQVQTLADLTRPEVQFINRQPGAGTRVWLDKQLRQNGIDAAQINGYTQEVHTHLQAALAIANGRATAGLAIEAAGTAYGLDFIPLTQERYDLVIPAPLWETPPLRTLAELIASPRFRDAVAALDGYEPVGDTAVYIT